MGDSENKQILMELKKISKLLALILNQNRNQNDLIKAMSKVGFQPKEIADLIGTTSNTVNVAKAKEKIKKGKKKSKTGKNSKQAVDEGEQFTTNES